MAKWRCAPAGRGEPGRWCAPCTSSTTCPGGVCFARTGRSRRRSRASRRSSSPPKGTMRGREGARAGGRGRLTFAPMPTLFVVSDLHLGESGLARMFHDQSQGMRFADLCSLVARTPDSELLLLGDIFDVTASLPPARGLAAFGRALDVPLEDRPARPLESICASIRESNP